MKTWIAVISALVLFGLVGAWAATPVIADQGAPGNRGPWPVTYPAGLLSADAGAIAVYDQAHAGCTNSTVTATTTGAACPTTPRADRKSIMIQLVQTGETATITSDGTTATATNGIAIADGTAYQDNLMGSVSTNCRCTAASCSLRIVECP